MAVRPVGTPKENLASTRRPKASILGPSKNATQSLGDRDSGSEPAAGLLKLQHAVGNQAVQRLIQAKKLNVGPAQDKFEEEAERVATRVTHSATTPAPAASALQRERLAETITPLKVSQKSNKDDQTLHRKATDTASDGGGFSVNTGFSRRLSESRGGGNPIPAATRVEMESKFGVDFRPVRIHTGNEATHLTRSVNSEAFTSGHDIYMGSGRFQPNSSKGRHLLAHELTHVVQQAGTAQGSGIGGDVQADQLSRKKIYRQFDFLKIRRKNARTVKKALEQMHMVDKDTGDRYGHWWSEIGDTRDGWRPKESYGMWPSKGPDDDSLGAGVPGRANAMGQIPKGKRDRDPLHGEKADDEFHPVVEVDQDVNYDRAHENYAKQIKSVAHSYKDKWKWRSNWSSNGQSFQTRLMRKLRMEIPRRKMPMLLNPKVMLSREAQENMANTEEFRRTQQAFARFAEQGGRSLEEMFTEGGLNAEDYYRSFDVTPEEQESRAQLLAQLNPQVSIDDLLKAGRR
jgi:hypothetical protein